MSTLTTFAKAAEHECINDRHCQRTHATCISAKTYNNPCSAVSLRELSSLFFFDRYINHTKLSRHGNVIIEVDKLSKYMQATVMRLIDVICKRQYCVNTVNASSDYVVSQHVRYTTQYAGIN